MSMVGQKKFPYTAKGKKEAMDYPKRPVWLLSRLLSPKLKLR